jgi:site-specific DNA-methyltransferase (adenine-specific)
VQRYGTGALNIDGCRIDGGARPLIISKAEDSTGILGNGLNGSSHGGETTQGRWPANVVLDETTAPLLDQQSGTVKSSPFNTKAGHVHGNGSTHGTFVAGQSNEGGYSDSGGASRFFKVSKADERGAISEHFPREFDAPFMYVAKAPKRERPVVDGVAHPTVKPLALMRWLVKLVTPPGGVVLDPFEGSGTTLEACLLEGFNHVGIEREADYLPLIMSRIDRQAGTLDVAA